MILGLKSFEICFAFLIIIVLAKPQGGKTFEHSSDRKIGIIVVFNASTNMRSLDFGPLNKMGNRKKGYAGFCERKKI
jgi:Ca-activated chloride channel family protein